MKKIPRYTASEEQELMSEIWGMGLDPYAFVMFVFPWGQVGTPLEHFKGPRAWQRKVLLMIKAHLLENNGQMNPDVFQLAVSSGRGIGKSALVSWLILWMISTKIGSSVLVSANSEPQLKSVTWAELIKWSTMLINEHWWEVSATRITVADWLATLVENELKKGCRYWGAEGKLWSEENPDSYAGPHNPDGMMLIFDEASGIPSPIWKVAEGYFTEPILDRYWFAFSNPRRAMGHFYDCFHAYSGYWKGLQIDARTVEGTDQKIYDKIISKYGVESDEAKVEVYGQFPHTDDEFFIPRGLIEGARTRGYGSILEKELRILGVDPGQGSPDPCALVLREGRKVEMDDILAFRESDPMTLVGLIVNKIKEMEPDVINIDMGGLGWGIWGRLREMGYPVNGVNFAWVAMNGVRWGNKRAEMWGEMKEWLRYGTLPDHARLCWELGIVRSKPKSTGVMLLEDKRSIRKEFKTSPDFADALALTFAIPTHTLEIVNHIGKVRKRDVSTKRGMFEEPVANGWMAY